MDYDLNTWIHADCMGNLLVSSWISPWHLRSKPTDEEIGENPWEMSPIHWFSPQVTAAAGMGRAKARGQELHLGLSPVCDRGPNISTIFLCSVRHISSNIGRGATGIWTHAQERSSIVGYSLIYWATTLASEVITFRRNFLKLKVQGIKRHMYIIRIFIYLFLVEKVGVK